MILAFYNFLYHDNIDSFDRFMGRDCDGCTSAFSEGPMAASTSWAGHGIPIRFKNFLNLRKPHVIIKRLNSLKKLVEFWLHENLNARLIVQLQLQRFKTMKLQLELHGFLFLLKERERSQGTVRWAFTPGQPLTQ